MLDEVRVLRLRLVSKREHRLATLVRRNGDYEAVVEESSTVLEVVLELCHDLEQVAQPHLDVPLSGLFSRGATECSAVHPDSFLVEWFGCLVHDRAIQDLVAIPGRELRDGAVSERVGS